MMKDLLVFDCFGVLYEEIAPRLLSSFLPKGKAKEVKERDFPAVDLGRRSLNEVFSGWESEFGIPKSEIAERWEKLIAPKEDSFARVARLAEKYDLVLLSNAPTGFVERLFKENGQEKYFKKLYVSSALRMAKPNRDIYEFVQKEQGDRYGRIWMIDDHKENLKVPAELGWNTILFTGINSLNGL